MAIQNAIHVLLLKHHLVVREIGKAKAVGESSSTQLPSPEPVPRREGLGTTKHSRITFLAVRNILEQYSSIFSTDFI